MLKRYKLQKQIFIIFSTIMLIVITCLMPIIQNNLTRIVDDEMYKTLSQAQKYFYSYQFAPEENYQEIYHFTYDVQSDLIYSASNISPKQSQALINSFSKYLYNVKKLNKNECRAKIVNDNQTLYIQIIKMDRVYLISATYGDYSKSLMSKINMQVIYVLYGAIVVLWICMLAWITSLIKPLKQIDKYIDDIKNNKEATLNINRKDEIGVLSDSLISMKQEIDHQNKVKEEMIHNISHDLKTPIALIKNYTQSIQDDIYPYGDKESSLNVILENANRLEKKVKSLLYLNRLDYIAKQTINDQTNMKQLIEHYVNQWKMMHLDIHIDLQLDDVIFVGKDDNWRICIENILDNAARYVKTQITIILHDDYLEIHNDGEKLDTTNSESLFKPYEIGHKGQFGLGLSIVYKTITMYGYTIEAINKNNGVSFIIKK